MDKKEIKKAINQLGRVRKNPALDPLDKKTIETIRKKLYNNLKGVKVTKKYSVLRDILNRNNLPMDSNIEFTTDNLKDATAFYNKLIDEIQFYDEKNTGASLIKNVKNNRGDYDMDTLEFYVYDQKN